ncbi:AGAP007105-PA [Anopheles gambiae str. PEST]|uniref:AGAP007105-PA n=4 Tax=gambiae species complex TaxID=44542 RepID=Q7QIW6_ANOGA|nr:uncharacterized protein LOC120952199 [Anopheles coluzzii]XP_308652.4 uncharacterized protein LOC1269997 [Anopheles gambiae]EAA04005.4 AGAP007105-PA [Anopheles gambiae str. PEST]
MEVMEEGNLMDRIPILLQRDLQYYEANQKVLQEDICAGVVGGKLDFPRSASFASVKIVIWLEDEYYAAYRKNSGLLHLADALQDHQTKEPEEAAGCGGIVKSSDPEKFVILVSKSVDNLLEHIHTLSQEALDHADLTVLTATIGAAALVKNSLFVWLQCVTKNVCPPKGDEKGGSLKLSYKQYSEMTEALAERLLDLHCRLLTLYIIQDADCLHWESPHPFFESERGSYTIQMWWLYMQGTKQDLWNSVPPTMAQRVFAGMLNETLTVLTVRYTQTVPSRARSPLLLVDVSNVLLCVCELLPAICANGEAFVGLNLPSQSKIIRDIHAKCQELFCCLLLRGIPLGALYKIAKKGVQGGIAMFGQRQGLIVPWTIFTMPRLFPPNLNAHWAARCSELPTSTALTLELKVLLAAPQANWWLLLKVLLMREAHLSSLIFHHLIRNLPSCDNFIPSARQPSVNRDCLSKKCEGFLCGLECNDIVQWALEQNDPIGQSNYQVLMGLTYIVIMAGKTSDINKTLISALEKSKMNDWASCLDRRQVWNQKRPPWLEAILHLIYPILGPVVHMLVSAVQTTASMYQAMSLSLSCFSEMWDCIPDCFYTVTNCLAEILPAEIRPLGDSVLIQLLYIALYSKLLEVAETEAEAEAKEQAASGTGPTEASPPVAPVSTINMKPKSVICQTLAEAICFIDEDNKHTEQINSLISQARESQRSMGVLESEIDDAVGLASFASTSRVDDVEAFLRQTTPSVRSEEEFDVENAEYIAEMLVSDVLVTSVGKLSMKMLYQYIRKNFDWILQQLGVSDVEQNPLQPSPGQSIREQQQTLIDLMFHIGHRSFDQLLSGGLDIDYTKWFQTPMSMSVEKAWLQVCQRWEFQEGAKLSVHEALMVSFITTQLKP